MATCVATEYLRLPKQRRLDKASGKSNYVVARGVLRKPDPYDDECVRQYILYHYQFHKIEGFVIDWKNLDYRFYLLPNVEPYVLSRNQSNDAVIKEVACLAMSQHNADMGTSFVFVDSRLPIWHHLMPNPYFIKLIVAAGDPRCVRFMSSGLNQLIKIAAVQVDPPPPLYDDDPEKPIVLFTIVGPGSGYMSIPQVVFTRIPPNPEHEFSPESAP